MSLKKKVCVSVLYALLAMILVWPSLNNFFTSSDYVHIEKCSVEKPIDVLSPFFTSWRGDFDEYNWKYWGAKTDLYRPLPRFLLTIEKLLYGFNPFGYHVVNAVLYWLCAILVFILARSLRCETLCSLAAGILFLLHPSHIYSLMCISSQKELLFTLWGLLTVIMWIRFRENPSNRRLISASIIYALAFLTKESGLGLLAIVIFYDLLLASRKKERPDIASWAYFALVTAVYIVIRTSFFGSIGGYLDMPITLRSLLIGLRSATYRMWFNPGYYLNVSFIKLFMIVFFITVLAYMHSHKKPVWLPVCIAGFYFGLGPAVCSFYQSLLCFPIAFFCIAICRLTFSFWKQNRFFFTSLILFLVFMISVWIPVWIEAGGEMKDASKVSETIFNDLKNKDFSEGYAPEEISIYYLFLPDALSKYGYVFRNGVGSATRLALGSEDVNVYLLSLIGSRGGPTVLSGLGLLSREPFSIYMKSGLLSQFDFPQFPYWKLDEGDIIENRYEIIEIHKKSRYIREIKVTLLDNPFLEGGRIPVFLYYNGTDIDKLDFDNLKKVQN
ncbi:MAG: glycosyltransferase family 39 protein [Candidatus Theseobacter exili]|nr:glycosyltransferase family 39 protein [Candidatus Theseobacter exili]